jgi:type I restriction enzyme S subunit
MNAERLLSQYERVSDAPEAINQLREFILNLAVRGKLVPQESRDEPASELAKRIAAEKARLVAARGNRGGKQLPPMSMDLNHLDLPRGWIRVQLGNIIQLVSGQHLQPQEYSDDPKSGLPYITGPADFGSDGLEITRYALVRKAVAKRGQLLLTVKGSGVGKTTTCNIEEVAISRQLMALTAIEWEGKFLLLVTHLLAETLRDRARSLIPGISREDVEGFVVALPPLAEQHRIIAKVDELMALCDRLEAARARRESTRDRLATACLDRLNAPDPDTFRDDARFALGVLPAITRRPEQINEFRQTILNLAIRAKLVGQDPNDEPAADLLNRINRNRMSKRRLAQLETEELELRPPSVPSSWTWTVADQLSADSEHAISDGPFGASLKTEHYISSPGFRVIRLQNIGAGCFREEHRTYIDKTRFDGLSKHRVVSGDLIVAGLVDPRVRCCQVPPDLGPAIVKADCYRFAVHPAISPRFALHYLNSPLAQGFAAMHHHGMTLTRIGLGNFRRIPFPLPPIAEQNRIVAKVDELMALCDRLEASIAAGSEARSRLLDALLREALVPAESSDLEAVA